MGDQTIDGFDRDELGFAEPHEINSAGVDEFVEGLVMRSAKHRLAFLKRTSFGLGSNSVVLHIIGPYPSRR